MRRRPGGGGSALLAALSAVLLATCGSAHAETWVQAGGFSRHLGADRDFRETHPGAGVLWRPGGTWEYTAGFYRNSLDRTTVYAGAVWRGLGPCGVLLGAATGYEGLPVVPLALPTCGAQWGPVGLDVIAAPPVGANPALVAVTFRVRWK